MSTAHLVRLAVVFALTLGSSAAAPPAQADTGVWIDPRADMVIGDRAVPTHTNGDIRRVRVSNGDGFVSIRTAFRDLAPRGQCIQLSSEVRTNRHSGDDSPWFYINAGPGCEDPGSGTWQARVESDGPGRLRFRWDWENDSIAVRFSRAALQNPRWVRVTVRAFHVGVQDLFFDELFDGGWTPRVYADSAAR